jgi:hypothetical protein
MRHVITCRANYRQQSKRIDRQRFRLEQAAVAFITHAPSDNLPGIDASVIGQIAKFSSCRCR